MQKNTVITQYAVEFWFKYSYVLSFYNKAHAVRYYPTPPSLPSLTPYSSHHIICDRVLVTIPVPCYVYICPHMQLTKPSNDWRCSCIINTATNDNKSLQSWFAFSVKPHKSITT